MKYGLYESTVMPCGLANVPFEYAMETIFGDMINRELLIYIDDISINSEQEKTIHKSSWKYSEDSRTLAK